MTTYNIKRVFYLIILLFIFLILFNNNYQVKAQSEIIINPEYSNKKEYLNARNSMIEAEKTFFYDSGVNLNDDEQLLNNHLKQLKTKLYKEYKENGNFPPKKPFYLGKKNIQTTELFSLIRKMPKGGLLHVHKSAVGRPEWIIETVTYRPDCYIYWADKEENKNIKGKINFFKPGTQPEGYYSASELRLKIPDFNEQLFKLITLGPGDEFIPDIWNEFIKRFKRITMIMHNKPTYVEYLVDAFETLAKDNIQYVELRTGFGELTDTQGNTWTGEKVIQVLFDVRNTIKEKYPDFEVKLILCGHRNSSVEEVEEEINTILALKEKYPDFIAGYDLVGEEDKTHTTLYYLDAFLNLKNLPLYLHAGESDWFDDENLFDAYLLNTKRIGHGFNLFYFPYLEKAIKKNDIAIEVCPISNQLLGYISDLRLHPGRGYIKRGVPIVISSDDPSIFQNEGLSYDLWTVVMAWNLDLKDLKILSMNSIKYSGMNDSEKQKALQVWQNKWDDFINSSIEIIDN